MPVLYLTTSAGAPRDTTSNTKQTNTMTNTEYSSSINCRITGQAALIKRAYIKVLDRGDLPAKLESWITATRGGIYEAIGDRRLNNSKVLQEVQTRAQQMIKGHLQANPAMAQRLADLRAWKNASGVKETTIA